MRTFNISHPAADAMDWNEAMRVIHELLDDDRYRDAMLVGTGCFLGLRISDILRLRWCDVLDEDIIKVKEKKTKKLRPLKISRPYRQLAKRCHEEMFIEDDNEYIFKSWQYGGKKPICRGHSHDILKKIQRDYNIRSAKVFSSHSLRKTFGRRVWEAECEKGRGENALVLLCDVFGHSNVAITKRYLGIRQTEILSVYDTVAQAENFSA